MTSLCPSPNVSTIPFRPHLWQIGDAFLLSVRAEPYSQLQSALRSRFPNRPIFISVVTNGTLAYVLRRDL